MFLNIITLVILVLVIVSYLLLDRLIVSNARKDRELSRVREDRLVKIFKRVEVVAERSTKLEQLVLNQQIALNDKMDALSRFIDERNTYVTFQQNQFEALAKSDMLAARRDELIRTKELKVALERIISMTTMSRQEPAAIDQLAIESVANRIAELEDILGSKEARR